MNSKRASALVLGIAVTALLPARLVAQTCPGDCNDDTRVTVNELVLGVNIALERADVSACSAVDTNHNLRVTVDELVTAVGNALNNCPTITTTPTPTATATSTAPTVPVPTPTETVSTGNAPPNAVDDAVATLIAQPIPVVVLANDSDPNADPLSVTSFGQPTHGTVGFTDDVATYTPNGGFTGTDGFTYMISDGRGGIASATVTVTVRAAPPDPTTVAPAPENGVATNLADSTSFLYTGADATQFGVTPDTIERIRAAVVRGQVDTRAGTPLTGVRITVLGHPELGFTTTRADGMFDMAANGGGALTINYEKTGFCPVQRTVNVPWQDYVMAPDVVMTPFDQTVTAVTLGAGSSMQVARGSMQSDANGARKATLLFPPGTTANLVMPDGSTETVSSLSVRATEFTVGATGPQAMPAILPPTSRYTYCVELSADEAIATGATRVSFSQPVPLYLENFLNFPVGTIVPSGFYDRQRATWMAEPNGRVIKILSITSALADVDTDGDNAADSGLGITTEERQSLATLYAAGQTLWRTPINHFSDDDLNWPGKPPPGATGPNQPAPETEKTVDPCHAEQPVSSVIECQNQILGESIGIVGTPFTLNYRSDRVPGREIDRMVKVSVSGTTVPASLGRIEVAFNVAGQSARQTFAAGPNQRTTFTWDGRDAYGRVLRGRQLFTGSIDYVYGAVYSEPAGLGDSFGQYGGSVLLPNPTREEIAISQPISGGVGAVDARDFGVAGWTLDVHHFYDPAGHVLYAGNGRRRRAETIGRVVNSVAVDAAGNAQDVIVAPDGSLYVPLPHFDTILRVARDGSRTVVAGNGTEGFSGDDGPATAAMLGDPVGVALDADGNLYIADQGNDRIRKVSPDGIITTVVGNGTPGFSGDNGPATAAQLHRPIRVVLGPDGSLYINDVGNLRIRRVAPDGIITTVAGSGGSGNFGDGGPATAALFRSPFGLAAAPDGSLFIADVFNRNVRLVGPDGIINTIRDYTSESARPLSVALTADGGLLTGVDFNVTGVSGRIDLLRPDGTSVVVAGGGSALTEQAPARQSFLCLILGLAVAPDGGVYAALSNCGLSGVARVALPLPGLADSPFLIASADGSQLYAFDEDGRHLQTLDALTGSVLLEFGYDAKGLLTQVIEKTGGTDNVTAIQRDAAGNPTALVAPFGQVTTLEVDANGFLSKITNPATENTQIVSTSGGLVTSITDPRGKTSAYQYDGVGRLMHTDDPADGSETLTRTESDIGNIVTRTSALGRATSYRTENLPNGDQHLVNTFPDGTQSDASINQDGTLSSTQSDGSVYSTVLGPDPRFGMESPLQSNFSLRFPSALQVTTTATRSAVLANAADPLSLVSLTQTSTLGGRTTSGTYTSATRTVVVTTPAGRTQTVTLDDRGRFVQGQIGNLDPVHVSFDDRGRLQSIAKGSGATTRSVSLTYNTQGFLDTITDGIGRTAHLGYDDAGRVTSKTLPDGRVVSLGYDAAGNLTSVTPPGRPAYTLGYSDRNELALLSPPTVPASGPTTIVYDADGAVTNINRAGVHTISIDYDAAGRPATRTLTSGGGPPTTETFSYDTAGRMSNVSAATGVSLSYDYDGLLPTRVSWSGPVVGNVARTYDASLRMASQSVNGMNPIAFTYDDDGLLTGAGDLVIVRDPQHGLPTGSTLGAVTASRTFNGVGEMTDYSVRTGAGSLYSSSYVRDGIGRIAQKVETIGGVSDTYAYAYDTAGQLASVTKNGATAESYAYDANGNRTTATVGSAPVNATYDNQDRLVQYGTTTFTYNKAGELVSKTDGVQTTTYDYDPLGNLRGVTLPDSTSITYVVDGLDRRVGRKVNGTLVQAWLYDDLVRPVAELNGAGAVVSRFVYSGGSTPTYLIKDGVSFRVIADQVGSVRLVVNAATGATVQRLDYDSFGNVLLDTNPGFQPFGFAGGLYDGDTKLVRFGTRDYDPETGRWTAPDLLAFGGNDSNLYRYCLNDPVNLLDPSGLDNWDATLGFSEQLNEEIQTTANPVLAIQLLVDSVVNAAARKMGFDPGPTMRERMFHSMPTTTDRKSEDYATGELAGVCVGVVGQLATGGIGDAAEAARLAEAADTLARQGRIAERLAAQEGKAVNFNALKEAAAEARNAGQRFEQQVEQQAVELLKGWKTGGGGSGFGSAGGG